MGMMFWLALAFVLLLSAAFLRGSVGVFAKGVENPWDNAIGYGLLTAALIAFPGRWMWQADSFLLTLAIGPMCWAVQTVTLGFFYQISYRRAFVIGAVHAAITSFVLTTLTLIAGAIAAFIMYQRIITDPWILIRLILRLIGLEV